MTNTYIVTDTAGRYLRTDTLPDAFAPVLRSGERARLATTGQVAAGTITGTGAAAGVQERMGAFTLSVWGTFAATVRLEVSFDGGTTWAPVFGDDGQSVDLSAPGNIQVTQTESGVLYRVFCSAFTSGVVSWQIAG